MTDVAIRVENLGKKYKIGGVKQGSFRESFTHRLTHLFSKNGQATTSQNGQATDLNDTILDVSGEFWALKDINFEIKRGEAVGIIGRNGAGKSTLLKILSRITKPTTGRYEIFGRVSSLLEVGTGFHPELSGRENVYLNGTILGMKRQEVKAKFDEIVAFSGVEKFIDTPVKHYSSGMQVRLAFSVAAHLEPEILIIDEVLAVGDAEFQKKCLGKMEDVTGQGRTVLFVSHNMGAVRNLCNAGIVLAGGQKIFMGIADQAIAKYRQLYSEENKNSACQNFSEDIAKPIQMKQCLLRNVEGRIMSKFEYVEDIHLEITFEKRLEIPTTFIGIIVEDTSANYLFLSANDDKSDSEIHKLPNGTYTYSANLPGKILKPGMYFISITLRGKTATAPYHKCEHALTIEIVDTITHRGMKGLYRKATVVAPDVKWRLKHLEKVSN